MRPAALAAGVAYVPGSPFHVGDNGQNTLRLSFSHLTETELKRRSSGWRPSSAARSTPAEPW